MRCAKQIGQQGVAEGGAETSWSNDTDAITLQDILELTKHIKQINLPINDNLKSKLLHWEGNPEEIERVNQVTVSNQFPILIMVDEQGQIAWILDGNHRLHKAIQSQAKTIPAKLIRPNNLNDKAKKIFNIKEQGVAKEMQHKKITELFDAETAFSLQWDNQFAGRGEVHAEAYDADGRTIDISFTPTGYGRGIEIVFKRGGSYDLTGQGDASRVLATVVNAISQYLQKYQPPYIAFSAKSTGGRAGAYTAMIKRLARGYTLLDPEEYPEEVMGFLDYLGSDKPFILVRS